MKPQLRYKPGDKIGGRYQVHKALMGGMGEVYLCLDLEGMIPLALKTFRQRYVTDAQRLRRAFEREVATWVALEKHPNVVRCFWMQLLDYQPFMVLEWVAGEEGRGTDLRGWLRRGPLEMKLALQVAIDICQGLLHARGRCPGLVHRDLKPENILMAQGGLAKITDFGLAQVVQAAGLVLDEAAVSGTGRQSMMGGRLVGTPTYMAPEQWRGEEVDARADIYAVGCILYELLTGSGPFQVKAASWVEWLGGMQQAHEEGEVVPLRSELSAGLNEVVQQCLAKKPAARYSNTAELIASLTSLYQAQFDREPLVRLSFGAFTAWDYDNRGVAYGEMGERAAALADFNRALEIDPSHANAYYNRGRLYTEMGERAAALADYSRALEIDSNDASAYTNRGVLYAEMGEKEAARADYNRAIESHPKLARAYNNRGAFYTEMGERAAALADFNRALEIDPNHADAYYKRGRLYTEMGEQAAALADFNRSIKIKPTYASAYFNRGVLHEQVGEKKAALADYNCALELDSNFAQAYYNRGILYAEMGEKKAALADYSCVLEIDPNYVNAYINRGLLYEQTGKWQAALTDYSCALEIDPNHASAYNNRGAFYTEMGERAVALADFNRALEIDPNYVSAYINRGLLYAEMGEKKAALADFNRVLMLAPNNAYAYIAIGVVLINAGQLVEALSYLDKAAELGNRVGAQYAEQVRHRLRIG